jgi:glycosyltransferase involved in cell wall biosynthesis
MKVVMTLTARDEADIIDEQLAFHLAVGVDFVLAADNGSTDGTTEILESYARGGYLHRIAASDPFLQIELVTELARRAATEFGADWVINSDADEFWWPRTGGLKEILATVPPRFGSVRGMWRNFAARPDDGRSFAERMTIRSQRPVEGLHPFNTHFKTVHRASPDVEVGGGNHDVRGTGVAPLFGWYPVDVLHFPIRSLEQFERKFLRHWEVTSVDGKASNPFYDVVRDAYRAGRIAELYDAYSVSDEGLAQGLADGTLVEDTRLRDALRSLRGDGRLQLGESEIDRGYLVELAYIEDNGPFVRADRRIEALEERTARLENGIATRLARRLARRA